MEDHELKKQTKNENAPKSMLSGYDASVNLRDLKHRVLRKCADKKKELERFYASHPSYVENFHKEEAELETRRNSLQALLEDLAEVRKTRAQEMHKREIVAQAKGNIAFLKGVKIILLHVKKFCESDYLHNLRDTVDYLGEIELFFGNQSFLSGTVVEGDLKKRVEKKKVGIKTDIEQNAYHLKVGHSPYVVSIEIDNYSMVKDLGSWRFLLESTGALAGFKARFVENVTLWMMEIMKEIEKGKEMEVKQNEKSFMVSFEGTGEVERNIVEFYNLCFLIFKRFGFSQDEIDEGFGKFFVQYVLSPNINNEVLLREFGKVEQNPKVVKEFLENISENKLRLECEDCVNVIRRMIDLNNEETVHMRNDEIIMKYPLVDESSLKGRFIILKSVKYLVDKVIEFEARVTEKNKPIIHEFISVAFRLFHIVCFCNLKSVPITNIKRFVVIYNSVKYLELNILRYMDVEKSFGLKMISLFSILGEKILSTLLKDFQVSMECNLANIVIINESKRLKKNKVEVDKMVLLIDRLELLLEPYQFFSSKTRETIVQKFLSFILEKFSSIVLKLSDISIQECEHIEQLMDYIISTGLFEKMKDSYSFLRFQSLKNLMNFKLVEIASRFHKNDGIRCLCVEEVKKIVVELFSKSEKRDKAIRDLQRTVVEIGEKEIQHTEIHKHTDM